MVPGSGDPGTFAGVVTGVAVLSGFAAGSVMYPEPPGSEEPVVVDFDGAAGVVTGTAVFSGFAAAGSVV